MDPRYTEQQEMVRKSVRDFAVNEIAPGAEERDRTGQFDYDLFKRLAALGVIGLRYPEEYGGSNAGAAQAIPKRRNSGGLCTTNRHLRAGWPG